MILIGIGAMAIFFAVCIPVVKVQRILFGIVVLTLIVYPKMLIGGGGLPYVGLAAQYWTIYTFTLLAGVLLVGIVLARQSADAIRVLLPWMPFMIVCLVLSESSWHFTSYVKSGLLQVGTAIALYVVAAVYTQRNVITSLVIRNLFISVIAIEALFVLSTIAGLPLHTAKGPQAADLAGRAIGSTNHPDQLAKVVLICLFGVLFHRPRDTKQARAQTISILLCFALLALTQSRATIIGALIGIAIYVLTQRDYRLRRSQMTFLIGVGLVIGAGSYQLISRFEQDPLGGSRGRLNSLALDVIPSHWWTGVGLNQYVDKVGQLDPLTASGVPVHNMFLFTVAEMGILAGTFVWVPLVRVVAMSYKLRRDTGDLGSAARAFLAILPAILILGLTGWGFLQSPMFQLECIAVGITAGALSKNQNRANPEFVRNKVGRGQVSVQH